MLIKYLPTEDTKDIDMDSEEVKSVIKKAMGIDSNIKLLSHLINVQSVKIMHKRQEINQAHRMLDELNACGQQGVGSIRERLHELLKAYVNGRPLPTIEQINYARDRGN